MKIDKGKSITIGSRVYIDFIPDELARKVGLLKKIIVASEKSKKSKK